MNENLPEFVVLGGPTRSDTRESIESPYPGSPYSGIPLALGPKNPLPFAQRNAGQTFEQQQQEYEAFNQLNELRAV